MGILRSFQHAFTGIFKAIGKERNLKVQLVAAVLVCSAGVYFKITVSEWLAIIICIGMVISMELINTAIEEIVNFISPGQHPQAGLIKDVSAGAVLVAAITSVIIAAMIFIPRII